ncbi:hypothetical protein KI688_004306 [Linnemannia hyalina]|uniref:Protein kinase domain-containing protein n=1 Tax=Linnemannia hyalina TaxID=64524 RepID=A0A9P7XMV8_9FUNG|nr:hypothetical protein KI688_004306 [Linnemannia hyalina]
MPCDQPTDNEVPQEEIDYFVSWIVDHYGDRNTSFANPIHEEYTIAFNNNDHGSNGNSNGNGSDDNNDNARLSVNYGPNENPHVQQRRSSFTKENPSGLNQVVKSLGFHRNDAELWIALELCAGGSVADLIRLSDGPMTESEIGWIMSQILLGLAYLHSKDHVHGDIKASNILLTLDGHVKLGGSGAIMSHKEGAGERKRRRRSLTMSEFPASWMAPESDLSTLPTPTHPSDTHPDSTLLLGGDEMNDVQHYRLSQAMPGASTEVDVWALGVACIEMSQGRPPRPETPILVSYGDWRYTTALGNISSTADEMSPTTSKPSGGCLPSEASEAVGMGMSEGMWMFIRKCLTPDPEARPTVQDLLQDPFILQYHGEVSQELLLRIGNMVDFVGQCASISEGRTLGSTRSDNDFYDIAAIQLPTPTSSVTLSPSKASHMIDFKTDEADWFIPRVRPRVDSVYDESSFFDEAGVQRPIGPLESAGSVESMLSGMDWKHQRVSHPKVMQALMRDQPRYLTFRHSRSPSLATIVEDQMEEDALFWSDDEGDSDDDDDSNNDGHDNDNAISTYLSQQYNQQCIYTFFQESQSQSQQQQQQQPWTPEHDKGGIEAFGHASSHVANGAYMDRIAIEPNSGLRSIVEYDFHGASSRLVVLYEIHESWLQ